MERVIETNESGDLVLSPEILREMFGEVPAHARYLVEVQGEKISVSIAKTVGERDSDPSKPSMEQWERQWQVVQEQVSKSWPPGLSAADVISEMRR